MLLLPASPVFCPRLPKFSLEEFFLDQEEVDFGEGPDPFPFIQDWEDAEERQLALLCLATREVIGQCMKHKRVAPWDSPGISCLTSGVLRGYCGFISSCVDFQLKQLPDLQPGVRLIYHQAVEVFPDKEMTRHMFLIANIGERFFIVDLSVRQFCYPRLRLRRDEAVVCDFLLKHGFIELTEHSLLAYRRLLQADSLLPSDELEPMSIESLKKATARNDYEDKELREFLSFHQRQLVRAYSQPIFAKLGAGGPLYDSRKMVRAVSEVSARY
jgi:hypothetical protein